MDKIIASLKDLSDVDALVVFDAENDYQVEQEFNRDYIQGIDLEAFKQVNLDFSFNVDKQIMLTEKGLVFQYSYLQHKFFILAAFRESTDIYSLQLRLDKLFTST